MNVLLASTSSLFGGKYLEYIKEEIADLMGRDSRSEIIGHAKDIKRK